MNHAFRKCFLFFLFHCSIYQVNEGFSSQVPLSDQEFEQALSLLAFPSFPENDFQERSPKRYILTGGAGVGKTCILLYLETRLKIATVREAATDLITLQLAEGVSRPYAQPGFNENVLQLMKVRQEMTKQSREKLIFFDRSPIDILTYVRNMGEELTPTLFSAIQEMTQTRFYEPIVFLIRNFNKVEQSEIREENLEQTIKLEEQQKKYYTLLGYKVYEIGPGAVEERAKEILQIVKEEG